MRKQAAPISAERRVKVFRNGLAIEPAPSRSLLDVLARLKPLKETFPDISDKPPKPHSPGSPDFGLKTG